MPVDSVSKSIQKYAKYWKIMDDVIEGEDSIKEAGEAYLPKLSKQGDKDYASYKARGSFLGATDTAIGGFVGTLMRTNPTITTTIDESYMESMTPTGLNKIELINLIARKILTYGYFGCLVDIPESGGAPYVVPYDPTDIINYSIKMIDGKEKLTMLVLKECAQVDSLDPFVPIIQERVRVLSLVDGMYTVQVYSLEEDSNKKEQWVLRSETVPVVIGQPLDFIPFVFFGALSNSAHPCKPPLLDLAYLNIKHWQVSVDYFYGLHLCALPTPWAAGFDIESELFIGPGKAWISEDANARCGYLEFSGSGMRAVKEGMSDLLQGMSIVGARMLEEARRVAEAAETVERKQSSDRATLSTIAVSIENGFSTILKYMGVWMNDREAEACVRINRDFVGTKLSAQDLAALLSALMQNAISLDTYLYNLKQGDILPEDRTVEDEKDLLYLSGSSFMVGGPLMNPTEEPPVENEINMPNNEHASSEESPV